MLLRTTVVLSLWAGIATAQQQGFGNNVAFGPGALGPVGGANAAVGGPNGNGQLPGGSAQADFESLIDLIQSTVQPDTWVEGGGGNGDIRPFPTGVWVDAQGVLRRSAEYASELRLASATRPVRANSGGSENAKTSAELRCVSLTQLEREIARRQAAHLPLDEAMLTLAGLTRVELVLAYPETGEVVLAGPAEAWQLSADHRILGVESGLPVVRLDDLLTLWRRHRQEQGKPFGCAITPRQAALAQTQAMLTESAKTPLQPGERDRWLKKIRQSLGEQDIEFFSLAADSHAAHVLIEADHHMKLIGIGLEQPAVGVESYFDHLLADKQPAASMSVLRWWFTPRLAGIATSPDGLAIGLVREGAGVRVLSENELLTVRGNRVHTGESDGPTSAFAGDFTDHFAALAAKYPVYGELRNVLDLAIAVEVLELRDWLSLVGWEPTLLCSAERLRLPRSMVPKTVESVVSHRVVGRTTVLAAVSGGVWAEPKSLAMKHAEPTSELRSRMDYAREARPAEPHWWWDAVR